MVPRCGGVEVGSGDVSGRCHGVGVGIDLVFVFVFELVLVFQLVSVLVPVFRVV